MGAVEGRIKEARREVLLSAARRWSERAMSREENFEKISKRGIGAGDTLKRRLEYAAREQVKEQIKAQFNERIVGPTNDLVAFAPSQLANKAAQPVGRIVTMPGVGRVPQGIATGFLISGNLLMTNYHVFGSRSDTLGYGVNFNYFEDDRGLNEGIYFELDADKFFLADLDFDFAIIAVKPTGVRGERLSDQGEIQLIEATGKVLTGLPLNIVQHPGGGPRRFAFTYNRLLDILPSGFLHYETDTEKGSSGSPVSNSDWELVGLHHCGVPRVVDGDIRKRDGSVWNQDHESEDQIDWIANECARVSSIVGRLKTLSVSTVPEQAILSALLASTSDPVANASVIAEGASLSFPLNKGLDMSVPVFNFSGPVTINVFSGQGTPVAVPAGAAIDVGGPSVDALLAPEKALVFDPDYEGRTGYDPKFLGVEILLPELAEEKRAEAYTIKDYQDFFEEYRDVPVVEVNGARPDDPLPLPYHHYTLVFNKQYRMCHWTASNCDYRDIQRQDTRNRTALGGENWRFDPRVPAELQLADKDIYAPAKRIDRGHIVRREDNAWGPEGLMTDYTNSDTYHWTNCTPQHEAFNQESPSDKNPAKTQIYKGTGTKGIWGQFEGKLQAALEAGGGQAVIFAGPILDDHFKDADWGNGKVAVPKKFWKVVVVPASKKKPIQLAAYGYIFDQEPAVRKFGMTYEGVELPEFIRQRQALADITAATGVKFAQIVIDAEQPL